MYHGKVDKIAGLTLLKRNSSFNISTHKFVSFLVGDVGTYDGWEIADKFEGLLILQNTSVVMSQKWKADKFAGLMILKNTLILMSNKCGCCPIITSYLYKFV